MTKRALKILQTAGIAIAATCVAYAAQAAASRYVSVTGRDAGNCLYARPCRTLQYAIGRTPKGAEIHLLNSGNYGPSATINKSITISGHGNTIDGMTFTVNDMSSDLAHAKAVVAFRNVVLNGGGVQEDGIHVTAAAAVYVNRSVVYGFSHDGIFHESVAPLSVTNSVFRHNGAVGIYARGGSVAVENSRLEYNHGIGLLVEGAVSAIVLNTTALRNDFAGYWAVAGQLSLESSVAEGSQVGLEVESNGTARISNSAIVRNVTGIEIDPGCTGLTRQNNTVSGNLTDVNGTLTPLGGV